MSALFCKITSNHDGDFYCLNCLHSFRTENKLKDYENVCKNHDYCCIEKPKEESISKYNHEQKSMKITFIIYADIEYLIEKIDTCHSNPEKLSTTKINKHKLLVIHHSHIVHLMTQKNTIIIEVKIAWKFFLKIQKSTHQN